MQLCCAVLLWGLAFPGLLRTARINLHTELGVDPLQKTNEDQTRNYDVIDNFLQDLMAENNEHDFVAALMTHNREFNPNSSHHASKQFSQPPTKPGEPEDPEEIEEFEDKGEPQHGGQCWVAMRPHRSTEDIDQAKEDTKREAEEEDNGPFKNKLLHHIIRTHLDTTQELPKFVELPMGTDIEQYFKEVEGDGSPRNAIFILGPSSSGKTTVAAGLPGLQFPLMTVDGADWREASDVWKKNAQTPLKIEGKDCLFQDYFKEVFQTIKPKMHAWMMAKIKQYRPKTLLIPNTAVPCLPPTFCKVQSELIKPIQNLGYTVSFVVIHAEQKTVEQMGTVRQWKEGKKYSSDGYLFAYASVRALMKAYSHSKWTFFHNEFNGQPPTEMEKREYLQASTRIFTPKAVSEVKDWLSQIF